MTPPDFASRRVCPIHHGLIAMATVFEPRHGSDNRVVLRSNFEDSHDVTCDTNLPE